MSIRSCGFTGCCLKIDLLNVPSLASRALGLWSKNAAECLPRHSRSRMRHAHRLVLASPSRTGAVSCSDLLCPGKIQHTRVLSYSSSTTSPEPANGHSVREDGKEVRKVFNGEPLWEGHGDLQSPIDVPGTIDTVKTGVPFRDVAFRQWDPLRGSRSGFRTKSTSDLLSTLDAELTVEEIMPASLQVQSLPSLKTARETLEPESASGDLRQVSGEDSVVSRVYSSELRRQIAVPRPQATTAMVQVLRVRGRRTPELVKSLVPGFIRAGFMLDREAIQKRRRQRHTHIQKMRNTEEWYALQDYYSTNRIWEILYRRLYFAKQSNRYLQIESLLDEKVTIWMNELFQDGMETSSVSRNWKKVPVEDRSLRQQQILLWSLANSPKTVPLLLEATMTPRFTTSASYVRVRDCLLYLERFFPDERLLDKQHSATGASFVYSYLNPNILRFKHHRTPDLLLKFCTDKEACAVFDVLIRRKAQRMIFSTALFLMGRFTKMGKFEYAMRALEYVRDQGYNLASPRVLSRCTTLLNEASKKSGDPSLSSGVLTRVLRSGVEPNEILRNVILKNVFKLEGTDVGWKVFNHLLAQGFKPDGFTYMTLIGDAISRSDNFLLDGLLARISENDELARDEILLGYSLHAIRRLNMYNDIPGTDDLMRRLFPIFASLHDIGPLKDLQIIPEDWAPPEGAISATSPPPPNLGNMIAAHLQAQTNPDDVLALYDRFRGQVKAQNPSILRLTETDYTYNAFLMALFRHAAYLPHSIRIVEDMLASHCTPTIITWTILLLSFMFHDQPSSAEKVRAMMLKRGIRFNQIAWDLWVRGHAGMNMPGEAARALAEMEREGFMFRAEDWERQKGGKGMQILGRILEDWQRVRGEKARGTLWDEVLRGDGAASRNEEVMAKKTALGQEASPPEAVNARTPLMLGPGVGTYWYDTHGRPDKRTETETPLRHVLNTLGKTQLIKPEGSTELSRCSYASLSSFRVLRAEGGQHDNAEVRREIKDRSDRMSATQEPDVESMSWTPVSEACAEALKIKTSKEQNT